MIHVLISGCNGKMGQEVAKQIENVEGMSVLTGFDKVDTGDNKFSVVTNLDDLTDKPDVIIDFSIPEATLEILKYAVNNKIPVVIATTGFTDEELNKITEYSKIIPIFKSANMSFEINLMANMVSKMSTLLNDSDIEIVEK